MIYKIKWKELEKKLKKYEKIKNGNIYTDWYVNNWVKEDENGNIIYDRSYVSIKTFSKGKLRSIKKCGYYCNINKEYVAKDKYTRVLDLMKEE